MTVIRSVWCMVILATAGILAAQAQPAAVADKLDRDLDGAGTMPVFVRMQDQVIAGGGDYAAFCAAHADAARRQLRQEVRQDLQGRSARARTALQPLVDELVAQHELAGPTWFWIVNGFAADASAAACRRLAERPEVAFVYRQRNPGRMTQHGAGAPRPRQEAAGTALLQKALELRGDGQEAAFDGKDLTVPWNLQRIGADAVWRDLGVAGEGVLVALCDSGLLVTPPLAQALWRNPGEELNGEDDDGNGIVDDLFGADFATGTGFCLGDAAMPHGSMCAGIVAGRPFGEPRTVTGVAPRARVMVLRGMGYLRAYEYALQHDADVLSMSYMWVNMELGHYRGLFRTAHEHLAAAGVVAVGGAGNFARSAPAGRQIALPKDIPCVIAAAGILRDGGKAPASSEGPCTWDGVRFYDDFPATAPLGKPDVTALFGGFPVWGRTTPPVRGQVVWQGDDGSGLLVGPQGNSFAGPHAAGVAALMLSAHPDLPAWRVKELMEAACQDLGEQGRDHVFGAGLLQAVPAVRAARTAAGRKD